MTQKYEELGYTESINAKITIDPSLPNPNRKERFFIDQRKDDLYKSPPDWVKERMHALKLQMEKYK